VPGRVRPACNNYCIVNPKGFWETFRKPGLPWSYLRNIGLVKQKLKVAAAVIYISLSVLMAIFQANLG